MVFALSISSLPSSTQQKVFFLWIARILLHTVVVLLNTLVLALFIAHYGGSVLPLLLLAQALLLLAGSVVVVPALRRFSVHTMLLGWLSFAFMGVMLSLLFSAFFLKWTILLVVLSFVLWHAVVFFALYIEQVFSPQEAETAIPLIESGEPIGGIIAGLIAALGAFVFGPSALEWILLAVLAACMGIIFFGMHFAHDVPVWKFHSAPQESSSEKKPLWKKNPLLQNLFWATLIQAIIFVIIEFQYLLAASELIPHMASSVESEVVQQLAHGLGIFHVAVFGILFVVQVFLASALQHRVGVIRTLFFQPVFLGVNALGLLFFSFLPLGMLGKGIYEVVGGVYKNALASVFYVFKSHSREEYREFLEGIARPFGMLIGAMFLILLSTVFHFAHISNILLLHVLGGIVMLFIGLYFMVMRSAPAHYTMLAERNVRLPFFPEEKFDAFEILSQKGHKNPSWVLAEVIKNPMESSSLKVLALQSLSEHYDMSVFSDVLSCLEQETDEPVQFAALSTLHSYALHHTDFAQYPFSKHRIITVLKHIFNTASSKRLRMKIIQILSLLQYSEMVPFLLEGISNPNTDIAFCSILACGSFRDVSMVTPLLPCLGQKNPYITSATIIALWPFLKYREVLFLELIAMVSSADPNMQMSGIYTIGELKIYSEKKRLLYFLESSEDLHIKKHAAIAMAKMGDLQWIPFLATLIFHRDASISESTRKLVRSPGAEFLFAKPLESFVRQKVLDEIKLLAQHYKNTPLHALPAAVKEHLVWLYSMIGSEKVVMQIRHGLEQ